MEIRSAGCRVSTDSLPRGRIGEAVVSKICLGTMRLQRAGDAHSAARLIQYAQEIGISSLHCSSEYESYPLLCDALTIAGAGNANVVAKVAVPHFGEDRFSANAFRSKVDNYLTTLGLERLEVVQWLLRFDLKQEDARLRIFADAQEEIADTVAALKAQGKIGAVVAFPYTRTLAEPVVKGAWCDGLALYLNPLEREMDEEAERARALGKSVLAIRPFAAGRLFTETSLGSDDALAHVFGFAAVASAVVSASTESHLDAFRPWL
jgi:aryl-alcohol dehydrogenase-like predicted oxidoreductase